jgi:2-hydroxychromene-2-carboxylate isomerase
MSLAYMKVYWAFDILSPFSYLSLKQLPRLPEGTDVHFVPVLFGSILQHHGSIGPAEMPSKRLFTYRFCLWRARQLGIELRFPPAHPFNPLMALRLIIAAGSDLRAVQTVFDAVFREGLDVSQAEVIAELGRKLAIADAQKAIADPAVKQKLHDNTAWAIEHGVFGVPSFVIGREVFWGQDAFEMAIDYLRDPNLFQDPQMQRLENLPVGIVRNRKT